jgi:parallel beta-helix repeat protein
MKGYRILMGLVVWTSGLLSDGVCRATDIKGTIPSTMTITGDSQLVGNVTCTVVQAPCIVIGASHVTFRLNGFTMTGPIDPPANCPSPSNFFDNEGIVVNGQTHVTILGPGVIQKFGPWGILLESSTDVTVKHVTANRNCWSGIQLSGVSDSEFEDNLLVNNAVGSGGAPCGGICVADSNKNVIRKSKFSGNGTVNAPDGNVDFGVGLEGASSGNRIEGNDMDGNANGVFVVDSTATGNVIRHNTILGNPPAQVSVAFPSTGPIFTSADEQGFDIQDTSAAGANTFEDNLCLTYSGAASPAPCPNVRSEKDNEDARTWPTKPVEIPKGSSAARNAGAKVGLLMATALLLAITLGRLSWNSTKFV